MSLYYATAQEMAELDELAVANKISIKGMMDLAGKAILDIFKAEKIKKKSLVVIVCGKGNKGGDGFSAARPLLENGYDVKLIMMSDEITPDAQIYLDLAKVVDIDVVLFQAHQSTAVGWISKADVLIDALIGYRLDGPPRGDFATVINQMNDREIFTISYDLPTGIDPNTAVCYSPCIHANATLTLALPKKIFEVKGAAEMSGKVYLADIGIPAAVYNKMKKGTRPNFPKGGGLLVVPPAA